MNITTKIVRDNIKRVRITLDLDKREAIAFVVMLERIGGNPEGPRGMFDGISTELSNKLDGASLSVDGVAGSIDFPDTWEDLEELHGRSR